MLIEFGGLARLAQEWKARLDAAGDRPMEQRFVLRTLEAIARLMTFVHEAHRPEGFEHLTDEELDDAIAWHLAEQQGY